MGTGQNNSFRWDKERKLSDAERAAYWENIAMQQRAEMRLMDETLQRYAIRIAAQNREIAEYHLCFGRIEFVSPSEDE